MNFPWAHVLTLIRLLCALPLALCMLEGAWGWAAALFTIAAATDYIDGPVARRFGQATALGGVFDHATDALFVSITIGMAAHLGWVPVALAPLIAIAFVQYLLDSNALAGQQLRASQVGRWNGIAYFVLAGVVVWGHALPLWPLLALPTYLIVWALVISTLVSIADRAWALIRLRRAGRPSP